MSDNNSENKLHVIVNGISILEFDRNKPLPGHQRRYLDQMDVTMDAGIRLGDDDIENPNTLQRAQYIANSLINALFKENYDLGIAMCTYLAKRIPDLLQIKAIGEENEPSIELVFDRNLEKAQQEQTIEFFKPESTDKTIH
ncbi:MAG TPA: hypothetical protein EYG68_12115 [Leucothrix mucor]|nr:hypothetical protein [Leucothrix mucor]